MAIVNPSSVERTLQKIIARTLRKEDVVLNQHTTFKQLGADSMEVVQILVALEEALEIDFEDEKLKLIADMGSFMDYIQQKVDEKDKSTHNKRGPKW